MAPNYTLHYWPGIPGRGEFIRLVFEVAGQPYADPQDVSLFMKFLNGETKAAVRPLAPPILETSDGLVLSQTPAILRYLGAKFNLAGTTSDHGHLVEALALTALDLANETHDVHHPISTGKYYEEQKEAALARSVDFKSSRIPKFLGYFDKVIAENKEQSGFLVGAKLTYADLVVFQVTDGLKFAFPNCMKKLRESGAIDHVLALKAKLEAGVLKDYLASTRRQKYSNGLFRHYPELDD